MLPPVTHKGRCCRGLSAHWLAHAFAWWRLSLSVSVCGSSFLPLDTLRSDAHAITRYTSALCYNPPRRGRTQACALRYSLIRWWVSTVGLSLPVGSHYTRISEIYNGNFTHFYIVINQRFTDVVTVTLPLESLADC